LCRDSKPEVVKLGVRQRATSSIGNCASTLAILVPSILGTEFMVGDDKGWTMNYDYQNWAKGKEFHVGDKLINFSVQFIITHWECTLLLKLMARAGNETLTSGNDVIPLETAGNKWYICGVAKHCEAGNQKLTITVSENNSSAAFAPTWMMAIFLAIVMMLMV
jgi:hypothetical protein